MHRVVDISLAGHATPFRLHDDAYERLRQYLDDAGRRLGDDADRAEVIGDLEQSIGDKLRGRLLRGKEVVDLGDVAATLEEIGPVEAGRTDAAGPTAAAGPAPGGGPAPGAAPTPAPIAPPRRRLFRIREDQSIAGVCTGLAAYADISVAWVRVLFVIFTILTAGGFALVYLLLVLVMPVVPTRADFFAAQSPDR